MKSESKTVSHPLVAAFGLSRLSHEFASPNRLNRQREKDGFLPAYDGVEAIQLFRENNIDLVVLDIMLPHVSGLSVLHEIRLNRQREKDGFRLRILYWGNERELCRH